MNTFRIRNRLLTLCLGLALLCLGSRAWQPVHGATAPPVPAGLTPADWQAIQGQVAKLTAADGAANDHFGISVSISGDIVIVGGGAFQDAAYVFYRDESGPGAWGQVAKLTIADSMWDNDFGIAVSISGDTAIVGASYDTPDNDHLRQGAAYVFYRNQGGPDAWGQVAKLVTTDGAPEDRFGGSVSINGDTVVIGAMGVDIGGNVEQGAAYIFYRDRGGADTWGQVGKITSADGAVDDNFGVSVSVSGDTAIVGSGANIGGAAYVYYRDQGGADAWGQVIKLTAADNAAGLGFGRVAVNGDIAIVGASGADIGGRADQGAAYIFYRNQGGANAWGQVVKLTAADGAAEDLFGWSVAVSGDTAVVGSQWADIGSNEYQGAAYIFDRNQGGPDSWGQVEKLVAEDGVAYDNFGYAVAVSGETSVVGAAFATVGGNASQGAAYVFGPTACVPLTDVSIAGPLGITTTLYIGTAYHFQAVITPVNATPPITYTWTPAPATGQGTADAVYRWTTPGTYTLTLAAENCSAPSTVVTATKEVTIEWQELHFVYLPLVQKN